MPLLVAMFLRDYLKHLVLYLVFLITLCKQLQTCGKVDCYCCRTESLQKKQTASFVFGKELPSDYLGSL